MFIVCLHSLCLQCHIFGGRGMILCHLYPAHCLLQYRIAKSKSQCEHRVRFIYLFIYFARNSVGYLAVPARTLLAIFRPWAWIIRYI